MGNDNTNIFLVAIVGIVAVAGLVFLFSGRGNATAADSLSGMATTTAVKTVPSLECNAANTLPGEAGLDKVTDTLYKLRWYDGAGNKVQMPLFIKGKGTLANQKLETENVHLIETEVIKKNDFFVLTPKNSKKSYLLQYKGADNPSNANSKIKFKDAGSGETLEYSLDKSGQANITVGGYQFRLKAAVTKQIVDDFQILVDSDGEGNIKSKTPVKIYGGGGLSFVLDEYMGNAITKISNEPLMSVYNNEKSFDVQLSAEGKNMIYVNEQINIKGITTTSVYGPIDSCTYLTTTIEGETLTFELAPKGVGITS